MTTEHQKGLVIASRFQPRPRLRDLFLAPLIILWCLPSFFKAARVYRNIQMDDAELARRKEDERKDRLRNPEKFWGKED